MPTRAPTRPDVTVATPAVLRDDTVHAAIRDAIPAIVGIAPLALALGAAVADSRLTALMGRMTAPLIDGAPPKFAALSMLGAGAVATSVVATAAVVNASALFHGPAPRTCSTINRSGFVGRAVPPRRAARASAVGQPVARVRATVRCAEPSRA